MDLLFIFFLALNLVSGILLLPYPINMFFLAVSSIKWEDPVITDYYNESNLPKITIQLPVYNEEKVIQSTLRRLTNLVYPRNRLIIQILDDSTDKTSSIIDTEVSSLNQKGHNFRIIRRKNRDGFKAGALTNGLKYDDSEFIALFDADFKVNPDFLIKTIHHFKNNKQLGAIQTRWGHSNLNFSVFTRSMSIGIDGHFLVEKTGRKRRNAFISFNGTGGIWRRTTIDTSGGWSSQTLAEDLDLAYRAQMNGYEILYLKDIINHQEIPPTLRCWIIQQTRWAKGFSQNFRKNFIPFWHNANSKSRFQGLIHLTQYFFPFLILINTCTSSILLYFHQFRGESFYLFGILFAIVSSLGFIAYSIAVIRADRKLADIMLIPLYLFWGAGLIVRMGIGAINGMFKMGGEFTKTPKFDLSDTRTDRSVQIREKIPLDKIFAFELIYMLILGLGLLKTFELGGAYLSQAIYFIFIIFSLLNLVFSELLHAFS